MIAPLGKRKREEITVGFTDSPNPAVLSLLLFAEWQPAVQILLYSLIFLLSVLGNSLVITVLIRNKRMRTVTNIFLLSLAVSDLMLCLFCMPFNLIPNLLKDFIFGSAVCKTTTYFMGELLRVTVFCPCPRLHSARDLPNPLTASAEASLRAKNQNVCVQGHRCRLSS